MSPCQCREAMSGLAKSVVHGNHQEMKKMFGRLLVLVLVSAFCNSTFAKGQLRGEGPLGDGVLQSLPESDCREAVESLVQEVGGHAQWTRGLVAGTDRAYRTPGRWREWLEVRFGEKITANHFKAGQVRILEWDKSTCKRKLVSGFQTLENFQKEFSSPRSFKDEDLKALLDSRKDYLIYLWSPGAVYSVDFMRDFAEQAKKEGLHFVPILGDASFAGALVQNAIKKSGVSQDSKVIASFELLLREGLVHFPSTYLISKGRISRTPITGVMPPDELKKRLVLERAKILYWESQDD